MDFLIRRGQFDDAGGIARVHVESWRSTYAGIVPDAFLRSLSTQTRKEAWQQQFVGGNCVIFVAECDGQIVGFVAGGRSRQTFADFDAELYAIYLLRENQGCGIGRALVNALVEVLRDQGFAAMLVLVLEKNPAVSFYNRLGAAEIARQSIEIGGSAVDELIYAWPNLDMLVKTK